MISRKRAMSTMMQVVIAVIVLVLLLAVALNFGKILDSFHSLFR